MKQKISKLFEMTGLTVFLFVLLLDNLNLSVESELSPEFDNPWTICDHNEWPIDNGEGDIEWRLHSRTVNIPIIFNEISCDDEKEDEERWFVVNGSRAGSKDLSDSRTQKITTQEGDTIRFYLEKDEAFVNSTLQQTVNLYAIEKEFSCNNSGLASIAEINLSKNFTLTPSQLALKKLVIVGDCHNGDSVFARCFRVNITVKPSRCVKGSSDYSCSGKGVCLTNNTQSNYICHCCPGYIGSFCEEKDACYSSPCINGGFCIDINEGYAGDTFQCLCPYGFTGKTCQGFTNQCDSSPCKNNGTCNGNQTSYNCSCLPGFAGVNCEININECFSNPCVHGICVDGDNNFRCFCSPGYGGEYCQFEYLECDSSPCINGGTCLDKIGFYYCSCTVGYTGNRCQSKIDLCQLNPCPQGKRCVDQGNNFTCECNPGATDSNCEIQYNSCKPNPCVNGGTCWSSFNTFFCACRPGFTGEKCEDVMYLDSIISLEDHDSSNLPMGARFDRLHNIYIVIGTLASAFFIVMIIVGICHCRVHKTYKRFSCHLHSGCSDDTECQRNFDAQIQPSLDAVYEAAGLDFADNLEAPLISSNS